MQFRFLFTSIPCLLIAGSVVLASRASADGSTVKDESCPPSGETKHYLNVPLRKEKNGRSDAGSLRLFYMSVGKFDPSRPTLVSLPGGPGEFADPNSQSNSDNLGFNKIYIHHRGTGCTALMSQWTPFKLPYEAGIFSTDRAADDIEAVKQELLGPQGKLFVYGVSYGSLLAQKYAIKYPDSVAGLILDSTTYDVSYLTLARKRFFDLTVSNNPEVGPLFRDVVEKYPSERIPILRHVYAKQYSYSERVDGIPKMLNDILAAPDLPAVRQIDALPPVIADGMTRSIFCEEVWDYPSSAEASDYFLWFMNKTCEDYAPVRHSIAFASELARLNVPTIILGGALDHIMPIEGMRTMQRMMPHSVLFENKFIGHSVANQKQECVVKLIQMLMLEGRGLVEIDAHGKGVECQSAPKLEAPLVPTFRRNNAAFDVSKFGLE